MQKKEMKDKLGASLEYCFLLNLTFAIRVGIWGVIKVYAFSAPDSITYKRSHWGNEYGVGTQKCERMQVIFKVPFKNIEEEFFSFSFEII